MAHASDALLPSVQIAGPSSASAGDFFALLKPRVMSLVVFTALVGMMLAPGHINPVVGFAALLAIAVGAGAAGCLNMWYDADIDAVMTRTALRPIPAGRVSRDEALAFGLTLSVGSVLFLGLMTNLFAAAFLAFTIFFYAVKKGDYAKAGVPMLPVTAGETATRHQILIYTLILAPAGVLPAIMGFGGIAYAVLSVVSGLGMILLALRVHARREGEAARKAAMQLFGFSILYLFLLFAVLLVEKMAIMLNLEGIV